MDEELRDKFIEKLATLMREYRPQLPAGIIIGALEVVKLRIFTESNKQVEDKVKKEEGTPRDN